MYKKKTLGENIQAFRLRKDYSIDDIQYLLFNYKYRTSRKSIYRWERNVSTPDLRAIVILCDIFKISVSTLLELNDEEKTSNITSFEKDFIFALRTNKAFKKVLKKILKREVDANAISWKKIKDIKKGK